MRYRVWLHGIARETRDETRAIQPHRAYQAYVRVPPCHGRRPSGSAVTELQDLEMRSMLTIAATCPLCVAAVGRC